jgi:hypothetical protein
MIFLSSFYTPDNPGREYRRDMKTTNYNINKCHYVTRANIDARVPPTESFV